MKKEWKTPTLEILDVSETMKGPGGNHGGGGGNHGGGGGHHGGGGGNHGGGGGHHGGGNNPDLGS